MKPIRFAAQTQLDWQLVIQGDEEVMIRTSKDIGEEEEGPCESVWWVSPKIGYENRSFGYTGFVELEKWKPKPSKHITQNLHGPKSRRLQKYWLPSLARQSKTLLTMLRYTGLKDTTSRKNFSCSYGAVVRIWGGFPPRLRLPCHTIGWPGFCHKVV